MKLRRRTLLRLLCLAGALSEGASAQVITTVAGTALSFPMSQLPALNAPLGQITSVVVNPSGGVYVVDPDNDIVAQILPNGQLIVVAGNGISGFSGDGGPATSASLNLGPYSEVALDSGGDLFIADSFNCRVRKVTGGTITTFAGNGSCGGFGNSVPATSASLAYPAGLAVDSSGNLFISESTLSGLVQEVSAGIITTVAGGGEFVGVSGDGGPAVGASLYYPTGIAVDSTGILYIADTGHGLVRRVSNGIIATVAGGGSALGNGTALLSSLSPVGITLNPAGNILYVADYGSGRIRILTSGVLISTIVGNGTQAFSGDGGPALSAALKEPQGVGLDSAGNLYIADSGNGRVRRVLANTISTIAGDGAYRFAGDGGAAISAAFNTPYGIAIDSAGDLYIADTGNNRVRKVSHGTITTVAGNGAQGFSGDNGPATSAALFYPNGVAVDSAGNLYIADSFNSRIRKVSDGIITTVLDSVSQPYGVAVDTAGNLYIADTFNNRILKVSSGKVTILIGYETCVLSSTGGCVYVSRPSGVAVDAAGNVYIADTGNRCVWRLSGASITKVAGSGDTGSAIDGNGGPATSADLTSPFGVAVDSTGTIYIADNGNNSVRQVSGGIITTVAGTLDEGFSGDGGLSAKASLAYPSGVAVDTAGNLFIADTDNNRIREVPVTPPALELQTSALALSGSSGGKPVSAAITVATRLATSGVSAPGLAYMAQVANNSNWLSLSPLSGNTPGLITVTADPSTLSPGLYLGAITFNTPNANPATAIVNVEFTVAVSIPANLSVDHNHLSFTYSNTSSPRTQTVTVFNSGGGPLPFTVAIAANPGQSANWLSVTTNKASATPAAPAVLNVAADPIGLAPGTYSANIAITSASGSATVSVTMTISTNPLIMLLSQTGLTFTVAQNGGAVAPQTFSVLNLGSGTMNWTAQTSVLGGVNNWLSATPSSGASTSASLSTALVVTVSVNANDLAPGVYYGLVTIVAPAAANTPQGVVAILQVLPAGTDIAPVVQPSSLNFTGTAGDSSPGSQIVAVYDPTGTGKSFRSGIATANGESWLETLPSDATIPSNGPVNVVVQPIVNNLAPGTYQGILTLQFSDGRVSTVAIQFVVTGSGAHARPTDANGPCMSSTLAPSLLTLGSGFSVPAGYPQGLEARVFDNCGAPQIDGTVFVSFNNGDPPVKLQSLGDGLWDGTWPVGSTPASVTLTVSAENAASTKGQNQINGGLSAAMPSPMVFNGGVVNSAGLTGQTLAPGEVISIFGQQLSGGALPAGSGQLPLQLAATAVAIGSQTGVTPGGTFEALPLYYASGALVNAVVPYSISVNTNQQILLQWGTAYAPPVYVDVASASPQVFQLAAQQGAITDLNYNVIGPNNPAHVGQVIVIYCSGLGAVSPSVTDGAGSTGLSYAQNPVTVTIGGQTAATPSYAGLTPGVAGLYQINVAVPQGVAPGDSVPVIVTVDGQTSVRVFTSVR